MGIAAVCLADDVDLDFWNHVNVGCIIDVVTVLSEQVAQDNSRKKRGSLEVRQKGYDALIYIACRWHRCRIVPSGSGQYTMHVSYVSQDSYVR